MFQNKMTLDVKHESIKMHFLYKSGNIHKKAISRFSERLRAILSYIKMSI